MPRRNRRNRTTRGRNRSSWIPVEGSTATVVYSGTIAAAGTTALTISSDSESEYRVLWMRANFSSEKPTLIQIKIRGEEPEQSIPSNIAMVNNVISRLSLRQPRNEGWWTGDGSQKLGWVSNIGSTEAKYLIAIRYVKKQEVKTSTRLYSEISPGHHMVPDKEELEIDEIVQ